MAKIRKPMRAGERYGNLVVLGNGGRIKGKPATLFLCDCGTKKPLINYAVRGSIREGYTPSCGCLALAAKIRNGALNRTHGYSGTKLYDVRRQMIRRCYDPMCKDYPAWGGRGIRVCDEWRTTIHAFVTWALAAGYREGVTIERRDNDGDYCPENCTWIPNEMQAKNTRRLRMVTRGGETHSVAEWSRRLDVPYRRIMARLNMGWSDSDALTRPVK